MTLQLRKSFLILALFVWLAPADAALAQSAQSEALDAIRDMRLQGLLEFAIELANEELIKADDEYAVALHLELARIHDRIGLHNNTRPVAEALRQIEAAEALTSPLNKHARAQVDLAYAEYYYRAEMADRDFDKATRYAGVALAAFQELEDYHGQADAVHRFGLISLQKRELDEALGLFEQSLHLDRTAGERPLLRADYERHVGYVHALREEYEVALPFFKRSLDVRQQAGADDPAMFAAISLASVLVELDRDEEAVPHLEHAQATAAAIDSATGRARVQAIVEELRIDLRQDFETATP